MVQKKDLKGRNLKTGEDQRENGMYRYRYTDKEGVRRDIYSWRLVPSDPLPKGKKPCLSLREMEKNINRDLDDKILTTVANTTKVYQQILYYFKTKPLLANSTLQNYLHMVEKNIKPSVFGQMKLTDVKKSDVQRYYAYLYKERKFSISTIQIYQNVIFPAFQLAVDDDIIRKNPCRNCMKDYVRGGLSTTKYPLTRSEQSTLLKFVKENNIYSKYYTIIAFMLGTGCRIGEVLGLTWNDIDFENKEVSINHQVIYKKVLSTGKYEHYIEKPKNKTSRKIPLQNDILKILSHHKQQTYFTSLYNTYELNGYSNFVFLNAEMKLYTPNTFTRTLHLIRDAYNKEHEENDSDIMLPDFSAHTFRHTFCTRMAENGMDVKVLQTIMGHKTIAVTMQVYNHAQDERVKKEMERVESALVV